MDVSDANDPELRSPKSFSRMDHEIHNDPFPVLYFTPDSLLVVAMYNINAHAHIISLNRQLKFPAK